MRKFYLSAIFIAIVSFAFSQNRTNTQLDWVKINHEVTPPNNSKVVTDWINYSGAPANSIGTGGAADFGCFMHIPTADLTAHDGRQIQEVMIQIPQPENITSAELRIYEEAGTGTPGTPIYTQAFTPNPDGTAWTTISISPYTIDASQELIVGYFINATGGYPAGCDAGPANPNGNLMIWTGSWTHLDDLNSSLTYNWNIQTGIGDAVSNDVAMFESTVSSTVAEGNVDITGTIANYGTNQITSVDINWQIDDGTVYTESLTGLTIGFGQTYDFTHTDQFNATVGTYTLKTWVSNMNGIGDDENTANDLVEKEISVIATVDAELTSITTPLYNLLGDVEISGKITNVGGTNITSFDITYNIDGGTESSVYSVTGVNIAAGESYNFTHDVAYNFDAEGTYTVNLTIANVNADEDANLANNELSKDIMITASQTTRMVLVEQFTTEACPNCPPVLTTIENHWDTNPNFIFMAHHSGYYTDWLTIPENEDHLEFYNAGGSTFAPAGMFDRHYNGLDNDENNGVDPGPVFWDGSNYGTNMIDERSELPAFVTVNINGINVDGALTLTVSGDFLAEYSHTVGVSLWITEDGITTTGQAGASGTWTHRFTTRDAISARLGDEITSPTLSGDSYSKEYTFEIDPSWNADNLYLVAMVNNMNDADVNDREIHNAKQVKLSDLEPVPSSVANITKDIKIYPNPANNVINITNAKNADVKIYDILGKLVISKDNVGKSQNINVSKLNEGTYFVRINRNNTVETQKIVISK